MYELLKTESTAVYEERFLAHKKEVLDAMRLYVADTNRQFRKMGENIISVQTAVGAEISAVKSSICADFESAKAQITSDIASLSATVDRAVKRAQTNTGKASASTTHQASQNDVGPDGHRFVQFTRGSASASASPFPYTGMNSNRNSTLNSSPSGSNPSSATTSGSAPRVELPQFDGSNPKLWQRRCEEYFQRWSPW